jgi:hypothetical protein
MHKAWFLLIPLVVGGCQTTAVDSRSVSIAIPIGQERRVDWYLAIHEDCTSMGPTVARVTTQPAHGTVSIREGREYPNFSSANPRSSCNKRSVPATLVYYSSAPGYSGADSFDVDAILGSGQDRQRHYSVIVK